MSRVKGSVAARKRRKKALKAAKGYRHPARSSYRAAKQAQMRAGQFAYRDRRRRKRSHQISDPCVGRLQSLLFGHIEAARRQDGTPHGSIREQRLAHVAFLFGVGPDPRQGAGDGTIQNN
jgi:ribosomal protein L20